MIDNLSNVCKNCIDDKLKHEIVFTVDWIEKNIISHKEHNVEWSNLINGVARSHSVLTKILQTITK